ncbi:putative aminoacyltransferase, E1 ubiquitin-activating enzyme [Rosa chinensis]|uniref:Putative aminoacyltransferase, E1 ubiquitin-activating enzyme n=1 Tax=Rosa chinensis TaxID=74649 RepID=A0A2P6RGS6_ROSCH|nr:putative aminoacyltransferase, E1 ubiquitin-activating enzyme [Rosa chinensis]
MDSHSLSSPDGGRSTCCGSPSPSVRRALELIQSDDHALKLEGAQEIRRLTKTSQRCRRQLSDSVGPLVSMLRLHGSPDFHESALLALLNLAVKDDTNKIKIVEAGALEPIITFLQSENSNLQEYATASLLTLSASASNKPVISACGAIPLLVEILRDGSPQAKVDSVMALSNLSTHPINLSIILEAKPVPCIVTLLKTCKNLQRQLKNAVL